MHAYDEDDWLARRLDAMRPGWRGRMRIRVADEFDGGMVEDVIGTIVGEPTLEPGDETDAADATATLCANYHDGRFLPVAGQPCVAVRASQIVDMQPM